MIPEINDLKETPGSACGIDEKDPNTPTKAFISWLKEGDYGRVSKDNIGWAISFALSVIYLLLLVFYEPTNVCKGNADGFCVTNYDFETKSCPVGDNSHHWAFIADVIFTIAAVLYPAVVGPPNGGTNVWIGCVIAIAAHGAIHNFLNSTGCHLSGTSSPLGRILYAGFTWFLSMFTLSQFGTLALWLNFIISVALATLTLGLSCESNKGVAAIFLVTQLLASGTVLFIPKPGGPFTPLVGKLFIAPCTVSIIELIACCKENGTPGLFNQLGGHVWYDVALHASLLATLIKPKEDPE